MPVALVVGLSYLFLRLDLLVVQLAVMSLVILRAFIISTTSIM